MKRTLKKLMALFCCIAITMTWLPAIPVMAADTVTEISGTGVTMTAGSYKLTGETTLDGKQILTGDLTIDLNGQTLKGTAAPYFTINDAYTLTITDSAATDEWKTNGGGTLQGMSSSGGINGMVQITTKTVDEVAGASGGVFNLQGGTLTGHVANTGGATGAIRCDTGAGGTINMSGGKITGNKCGTNATAIMLYNNTLNMSGGVITGNDYIEGAAGGQGTIWFNSGGVINMTDGEIYGNNNVKGDNIYSNNGGVLNISGGVIGKDGDDNAVWNTSTASKVNASGSAVIGGGGIVGSFPGVTIGGLNEDASIVSKLNTVNTLANVKEETVANGYLYTYDPNAENISGDVTASYLASGGNVKLNAATHLSGTVNLSGDLTVDLNGQTLTGAAAPYFKVVSGSKLTITDSSSEKTGKLDGSGLTGSTAYGLVYVSETTARLNLEGGTITGHTTTRNGAGVYNNGIFTMTDGAITNNISGGTRGSAVFNNNTFTMTGGEISGNSFSGNGRGAIALSSACKTEIGGSARIVSNKAQYGGALAAVSTSATAVADLTIGGTAEISGNIATAGAPVGYLEYVNVTMTGGTIQDNLLLTSGGTASNTATGLFVGGTPSGDFTGSTFNMSGGTIGNNAASLTVGGVETAGKEGTYAVTLGHSTTVKVYGSISGTAKIGTGGAYVGAKLVTVDNLAKGAEVYTVQQLTTSGNVVEEQADGKYRYTVDNSTLSGTVAGADIAAGGEYVLGDDVTLNGTVTLTGDLTIDLAGHTLTGDTLPFFKINSAHTLTIKDSSGTLANEYTDGTGQVYSGLDGKKNGTGVVQLPSGGGKFVLEGGTITGHTATDGNVGAVRMSTDAGATFEMRGGKITGNTVTNHASAVMVYNNTFNMSGGKITGNTGTSGQGAVWINGTGLINMTGGEISGNNNKTADNIYMNSGGTVNISGGTIGADGDDNAIRSNSTAVINISGNAVIGGGGITSSFVGVTVENLTEGASIVSQGQLANVDDSAAVTETDGVYTYKWLDPSTVSNVLSGNVDASMLAIPQEYTLAGNVTLTEKITLGEGAFVLDLNGYTLTGTNAPFLVVPAGTTLTVKDSSAGKTGAIVGLDEEVGPAQSSNYQGMVYVSGGVYNMYDITMRDHHSRTGYHAGAVRVQAGATFNMYSGTITNNTASKVAGGVLAYGTFNMYGGTITGNTAGTDGGGIWSSGELNISGGSVTGNTAKSANEIHMQEKCALTVSGSAKIGDIYRQSDNTTLHLGHLSGDARVVSTVKLDYGNDQTVAESESDGVYTYTAKALAAIDGAETLTADTTFTAGKIYVMTSDVALASKVTLTEGEYTIYLDGYTLTAPAAPYFTIPAGATLNIYDRTNDFGRIKGLASGGDEMLVVSGVLNLYGGDLTGHTNTASGSGSGGAVKVNGGGVFTMSGGIISDNTATGRGGAINSVGGSTVSISGGTISGNTAQYGGVLYANGSHSGHEVTSPVTVVVSGGLITGNTATAGGSALYMNDGSFTMTDGRISGNIIKENGQQDAHKSTIRVGGMTMTITGGIIDGEAESSAAVNSILVGDNGSGDNAIYSSLAISGETVITGGGIDVYGTAGETAVTVANLVIPANIISKDQLTCDAQDENVEEYQDSTGLWHYEKIKTLRVLSIGNSYSRDSFYYLTRLSLAVDMPIEAAYLYKGSCTIREHANYMAYDLEPSTDDSTTTTDGVTVANNPSVIYSYYKANMDPSSSSYGDLKYQDKVNAAYALADGDWDIIMLHQGTTTAGFAGTYNSDIDYLVDAIKAAQPNAKLYWNMIWAFDDDSTGRLAKSSSGRASALKTYYNNDQATMYNAILSCTTDNFIGEDAVYAADFEGWFPVGTAIQTMRGHLGDNLTRDGYHLSLGGGRMTAAMTILKVLRPEADLSLITAEEIAPYLDTTDDRLTSDVETFTDVFTGSEEQLALIRAAVTQATADLTVAPAQLAVTAPVTVEQATNGDHETVAQATAPMKLHFPDIAKLSDGRLVVSAYENVGHTPTTDATNTDYDGFGSEGGGRLIVWTGSADGTQWSYDEPLLVIDQKQLEDWGIVSLYDRYAKLAAGTLARDTYVNFSDPRDPNLTSASFDVDGDGQKEDVLLLTFWVRNFKADSYSSAGVYMTWSADDGESWAKPQKVTQRTSLKRGDMAVFADGQVLIPSYSSNVVYVNLVEWDAAGQKWNILRQTTITDFAPDETNGGEFNEASFVVPNPDGDVVYAFIRANGIVVRSADRGNTWELYDNEDNADIEDATSTLIHQPGFALIDTNRVFVTWARQKPYPRNTIGKVFELNNPGFGEGETSWDATEAFTIYNATGYDVTTSRDMGDPSAEIMDNGNAYVVTYDSAYRAIVGSRVTVEQAQSLSGSANASTLSGGGHYVLGDDAALSGKVSVTDYLTIDLAGSTLTGDIAVPAGTTLVINDSSAGKTGELNGTLSGAGTIIISGGTFTTDPTQWLAEDTAYVVNEVNGRYEVKPGLAAAPGGYVDFGSALEMGVYLQGSNGISGMGYTVQASTGAAELTTDETTGQLLLLAKGIPAKNMRDDITYTVMKGDAVYYQGTMSIYDTTKAWYDETTDEDLKTMLADMLNYGAAAQRAFKYGTVTDEALPGSTDDITWTATDNAGVSNETYAERVAFTLSLKEKIELNVYIDDTSAGVSGVTLGGTAYDAYTVTPVSNGEKTVTRITFGEIDMVDAQKPVTFTVTLAGGETFDVTYSIKDYVVNTLNGAQKEVVQALQRYVESVTNYITANS